MSKKGARKNVTTVKPNSGRSKRTISDSGNESFKGRFGTSSIFQPIHFADKKATVKRVDKEIIEAKFEQASFYGCGFEGSFPVIVDSDIWTKLPD